MEEYIQEALVQKYIIPSTSPASTGFYFIEKIKGDPQPCIDYRGLITVKYSYPLPLVPVTLMLSLRYA